MSDHALKPWHCTVFSNIFTLITKLYDAQKCAPAFADFTAALFKPSPEWLKVHSNAEFSQRSAQQSWRAKLSKPSVAVPSTGGLVPQKLLLGKTNQTTKSTHLKQCWKHVGTPLPPLISPSFVHPCLLLFQIQFYSPQILPWIPSQLGLEIQLKIHTQDGEVQMMSCP